MTYAAGNPVMLKDDSGHRPYIDGASRSVNQKIAKTYFTKMVPAAWSAAQSAYQARQRQKANEAATKARWCANPESTCYKKKHKIGPFKPKSVRPQASRQKAQRAAMAMINKLRKATVGFGGGDTATPFGVAGHANPAGCRIGGSGCRVYISRSDTRYLAAGSSDVFARTTTFNRWAGNASEAFSQVCGAGQALCRLATAVGTGSAASDIDLYLEKRNHHIMYDQAAREGGCVRYRGGFNRSQGAIVRPGSSGSQNC